MNETEDISKIDITIYGIIAEMNQKCYILCIKWPVHAKITQVSYPNWLHYGSRTFKYPSECKHLWKTFRGS